MSRVRRNDPCPCGSGRKAKRCCTISRGPGERELATAYLAGLARDAVLAIGDLDGRELDDLWDELLDLPDRDLSLLVDLPQLISPELERLFAAIEVDDPKAGDLVLPNILDKVDAGEAGTGRRRSPRRPPRVRRAGGRRDHRSRQQVSVLPASEPDQRSVRGVRRDAHARRAAATRCVLPGSGSRSTQTVPATLSGRAAMDGGW